MSRVAVIVGTPFVILMIVAAPEGDSSPSGDELKFGARDVCHQFVEDRLRAPATAGFENSREATISVANGIHTVRGHVDSENGFGALIRSDYTCQVRHSGGENFTLVSLTGLE